MDLRIQGNAALVTASSSGLGKAAATALAAEGVDVVINGRDPDRLEAAADAIRAEATGEVRTHQGDLTDPNSIPDLVNRPIEAFGRLDHLVTSAGGPPSGAFSATTDSDWEAAFELLVMSVVRTVREAIPHLRADGGGTIVTIASRSVKEPIDSLVLSNAVRTGVVGLEKTLSRELSPEIRANAVLPGAHETDRMTELLSDAVERDEYDSYQAALDERTASIPLGRMGDPRGLGDTVAFLSSPRSGFITGETVTIDGGVGRSTV